MTTESTPTIGQYVTAWSSDLRERGRELADQTVLMVGEFVSWKRATGLATYRDLAGEFVAAQRRSALPAGPGERVLLGRVMGFLIPHEFGIGVVKSWPIEEVLGMTPSDFAATVNVIVAARRAWTPEEIMAEERTTTGHYVGGKWDSRRGGFVGGSWTQDQTLCPLCRVREEQSRLLDWGKDRPFRKMIQLDGFNPGPDGRDEIIYPDEAGYCVMVGQSTDPRRTGTVDFIPVRVQIAWETPTQVVLDLLDRMREAVANGALDSVYNPEPIDWEALTRTQHVPVPDRLTLLS